MGCHFLLQGIFLTQGSNLCLLCLLYCQADSLPSKKPEGQLIWGAAKSLSKGLGAKGTWNGVLDGLVLLARAGVDEALYSWLPTASSGPHMKRCLWSMGAGGGSQGGEGCGPEWKTSSEREDERRERGLKLNKERAADRRQSRHSCAGPPWLVREEWQVGSKRQGQGEGQVHRAWVSLKSDGTVSPLMWGARYAKQKAVCLDFSFKLEREEKQ